MRESTWFDEGIKRRNGCSYLEKAGTQRGTYVMGRC